MLGHGRAFLIGTGAAIGASVLGARVRAQSLTKIRVGTIPIVDSAPLMIGIAKAFSVTKALRSTRRRHPVGRRFSHRWRPASSTSRSPTPPPHFWRSVKASSLSSSRQAAALGPRVRISPG